MDKYEYKVRADEIRDLISQGQYGKAAELADTIDWSRVKKTAILCTISDLYKKNRRYDDAIELLQLAYERNRGGKDILYSLCELYIKTNNIINTVSTYKEFLKVASNDSRRYILQYKIYEMEDVTLEERIEVLEELKSRDYREKWAYTLAYLYHRAGLATKCVEECDELILWFDEGKYVYMAMELKMRHQPLTPSQQEKYDHRFDTMNGISWQSQFTESAPEAQATEAATEADSQSGEQEEKAATVAAPISDMEKAALAGQTVVYNPVQDVTGKSVMVPNGNTVVVGGSRGAVTSAEAIALSMGYTQVYHGMEPEPEIQVKPVDVGEYNTINLQQALAEGVAEVLDKNGENTANIDSIIKADTKEIYPSQIAESVQSAPTQVIPTQAISAQTASTQSAPSQSAPVNYVPQAVTDKTVVIATMSGSFDATKTIPLHDIQKSINSMEAGKSEAPAEAAPIPVPVPVPQGTEQAAVQPTPVDTSVYTGNTIPLYNNDLINSITMPRSNFGATKVIYPELTQEQEAAANAAMSAQPPEQLAEVMTQEPDGQLSLVMPEDKVKLVSQITGQLSINDVMVEWNRLKYEREELNRQRYHEIVKQQTGEIFNEFERAALNGVLETLEKESEEAARAKEEAEKKTNGVVEPQAEAVEETPSAEAGEMAEALAAVNAAVAEVEVAEEAPVVVEVAEADAQVAIEIAEVEAGIAENLAEAEAEVIEESAEAEAESIEKALEAAAEEIDETAETEAEVIEEATETEAEAVEEAAEVEAEAIEETVEAEAEVVEEVTETEAEAIEDTTETEAEVIEETSEADEEYEEDEYDEDEKSEEESSEEEVDPRDKSYHVIGMNETTNLYMNKKKKKLEAKAAEESVKSESAEEDEDDDTRELTPEEKELFGPYLNSKESRKQLINVVDNISMASYTGNVIITGGDESDVSNLATVIMKDIKQTDSNFSGKVARVPGKSLNNKKMEAIIKQLSNGALIIENASAMSDNTAANLYKCLDTENLGIIITMLDTERNMEKLLSRAPRLSPLFTARMNVKPLSKEQLAEFAVKYAYEQEFSIDQMGMLGLHRMIEARQTSTHSVNVVEVKEIVDQAIAHVKKKTIGHFFDILGGKRYDSEDMIILGEKDFR